jgi:flagellar protein FlgJ
MDIGALSSYLKDNQALPLGNSISLSPGSQALLSAGSGEGDTFSQLLDRLTRSTSDTEAAPATSVTAAAPALSAERYGGKLVIDKTSELFEQCQELETFLVKTLITGMRSTVQKSGLIDEGFAGKMYEDMLYDEYTKDFTKNANFGLAELAYAELTGQRGKLIADHA